MATVAVGLDVGTTGVKALAVTSDGEVVASAESHYGLSQPQPGWSEQAPADWWTGSEAAIAALGRHEIAGIGLSGQMHGLVALDEHDRVLRPAILWNDQRTAAECAEIEGRVGLERLDRADRQPRPDRLHGAEAAVVAHARARGLRPDPAHPAAQGLRAPAALRRARDRRRRRLRHAALRRRRAPFLERRARRARRARELDAALARIAGDLGCHRRGRPRGGGRRRLRGRGARRRRRATGPRVARARDVRRRLRRAAGLPAGPSRARARLLPRGAGCLARHGRDALGGRLAAVGAGHVRAGRAVRRADGGGGGRSGRRRGHHLPALSVGRAHAARRPGRARARSSG